MRTLPDKWAAKAKINGKLVFWLSCFLAVSALAVLCQAEVVDRVVAVVNGEPVTLSMVENAMNAIWIDPQNRPGSQQAALRELVDHKLKLQEARRLGADVIVSEERLSHVVADVASRFASPKEASEMLRRQGISQEDLEERLIEEIMIQEMVNRKFRLFAEITDIEASVFFEQHKEQFVIQETVSLEQIFFRLAPNADSAARETARKTAEAVHKKLKSGVDFSTYAAEEEMDDYIAVDQLIPVVAAAVSRIAVGEISDPIETPAGYFIIKLKHRRSARQAVFDDVKADIKEHLIQQKTDAELNAWLENQRKTADIRLKIQFKDQ